MPTVVPNFAPAVEAFTRGFVEAGQARQAREQRAAQLLLEGAKADPTLFDSPVVQKQLQSLGLDKDEYDLLAHTYKAAAEARDPESRSAQMLTQLAGAFPEAFPQGGAAPTPPATATPEPPTYTPYTAPTEAPAAAPSGGVFPAIARGLGFGGAEPTPELPVAPGPAPKPFAGSTAALIERARRIPGATVSVGGKEGVKISIKGKTIEQAAESQFYGAVAKRQRELLDLGGDPDEALKQSITEMTSVADQHNILVPKDARTIANTGVTNLGKVELRNMQKQVDLHYAPELAEAAVTGRRRAEIAHPKTADERIANVLEGLGVEGAMPTTPEESLVQYGKLKGGLTGAAAAGRITGAARAKEVLPLEPKEAPLWFDTTTGRPIAAIDPTTGQPTTLAQARGTAVRVSPDAVKAHNTLAPAEGFLAQWKDAVGTLFPKGDETLQGLLARGGVYNLSTLSRGTLVDLTPEQKDAVTTVQEAQNNVLLLLRSIGERGNVAARLVDKAGKTGPSLFETRRTADSRIQFFSGIVAAALAGSGLPLTAGQRALLLRGPQAGVEAGYSGKEVHSAFSKLLEGAPGQPPVPPPPAGQGGGPPPAPSTGDADLDALIGIGQSPPPPAP